MPPISSRTHGQVSLFQDFTSANWSHNPKTCDWDSGCRQNRRECEISTLRAVWHWPRKLIHSPLPHCRPTVRIPLEPVGNLGSFHSYRYRIRHSRSSDSRTLVPRCPEDAKSELQYQNGRRTGQLGEGAKRQLGESHFLIFALCKFAFQKFCFRQRPAQAHSHQGSKDLPFKILKPQPFIVIQTCINSMKQCEFRSLTFVRARQGKFCPHLSFYTT